MRTWRRLLFFVVVLIVGVLAAAVAVHWRSHPALKQEVVARVPAIPTRTNAALLDPRVTATNAAPVKFIWRSIETNDFKQYIANLRRIGCPEETIRHIILPEVSRRYTARLAAELEGYWRNFRFWDSADEYKRSEVANDRQAELNLEKLAFLAELFGEDAEEELGKWWEINNARDDYDVRSFLPKDKARQVKAINRKYERLQEAFFRRNLHLTIDEYDAERNKLQAQAHAEIARILTPHELEDYEMRTSPASRIVRRYVPEVQSEEEFRAMVKLAKALNMDSNRKWEEASDLSPEDQAKRKKAEEKAFQEAFRAALGEERYNEIVEARREEARRRERQDLVWMAKREGISEEAANEAHARMTALATEVDAKLSSLQNLSPDQQKELAAALKQEQEKILVEIMGEKGHNVFTRFEQRQEQRVQDSD